MKSQNEHFYQKNITNTKEQIKQLSNKINRFALLRLAVILLGGFALFQVIQSQQIALTLFTFIIVIILFFWMVSIQSKLTKARDVLERFLKVNENEVAVAKNRTNNLYDRGENFIDDKHLYSSDLDIYGSSSLFQLVNRAATKGGIERLSHWFNAPANKQEIKQRQEFVRELTSDFEFWQGVQTQLILTVDDRSDYKAKLENYLSKSIPITESKILRGYVKIAPFLMLVLLIGGLFLSKVLALFIVFGILHFLLSFLFKKQIDRIATDVDTAGNALSSFASVFKSIEEKHWKSELAITLLNNIQEKAHNPVSQSIKSLSN